VSVEQRRGGDKADFVLRGIDRGFHGHEGMEWCPE
jgi:hypothetical protein